MVSNYQFLVKVFLVIVINIYPRGQLHKFNIIVQLTLVSQCNFMFCCFENDITKVLVY